MRVNEENIIEGYFDRMYNDYNYFDKSEEEEEVEIPKCQGDMCMEYAEDDDTHLCKECQKLLQRSLENFMSQFNEVEQEYIKYYIKEKEMF